MKERRFFATCIGEGGCDWGALVFRMEDGAAMGEVGAEMWDIGAYEGDKLGEGWKVGVGGCSWVMVRGGGSS